MDAGGIELVRQGVVKRTSNPFRMGVAQSQISNAIPACHAADPLFCWSAGDGAQHAVDEPACLGRCVRLGQFHRRVHGGVIVHAGAQDLIAAQAQDIQGHGVDLVHGAAGGLGDDGVQQSGGAQGAVGQLGCEGSIAGAEPGLLDGAREAEVGEGIVQRHLTQHRKCYVASYIATAALAGLGLFMLGALLLVTLGALRIRAATLGAACGLVLACRIG